MLRILETPRDAIQGIPNFIPTHQKVEYINSLLKVGFDTIDFGSFVSPKAIPQMRDSAEVIGQLNTDNINTKIIATVGSLSGAKRAFDYSTINGIAFPWSISEIFLKKNINSDFHKSEKLIGEFINLCQQKNRSLKFYIAMAFGNPYGDDWNTDILIKWIDKLLNMGVTEITLADTTGDGSAADIANSFYVVNKEFPSLNAGVHLHTLPTNWQTKVSAAYDNGCRGFDTVIGGLGGCPMSGKALMANLNTMDLVQFAKEKGEEIALNSKALIDAVEVGNRIFLNTEVKK